MRITLVDATDLPELLALVRAHCDFYQVTPATRRWWRCRGRSWPIRSARGCSCWPATTPAGPSADPAPIPGPAGPPPNRRH
jgi:hypothetical protein